MNILILGSGGREHALAWKIIQSKKTDKLYIAPGNAGTAETGKNINISPLDFKGIADFSIENNIQMIIVGPEEPLVKGIVDYFHADPNLKKIGIIGPDSKGALLEGSKDFSKAFMKKYNIPTAGYQSFTIDTLDQGYDFLSTLKAPWVLKADGLAAGKGVLILNEIKEAKDNLKEMLSGKFGEASNKVVIEEFLKGIELSVFVISDGKNYKILPEAKDYKRIGEKDTGLNTGGMGAVSPVPFADINFMNKVEEKIIKPTINGLIKENIKYKGFIFFGLIKVGDEPFVIEYNARMGDPETEVVVPRIKTDIVEIFESTINENLDEQSIEFDEQAMATIMLVSGGYPEDYKKNKEITGIKSVHESIIFHAGTKESENKTLTNGGRVIAISSFGKNIEEALLKSYNSSKLIIFENMYFRKDIGHDVINLGNDPGII
ncbi:MAG: phosphoribosylamine--glycine ligase [Bacteroidota bacterium]